MMGSEGVTEASRTAIVHANYIAQRLKGHFDVLYTGATGNRSARVHHRYSTAKGAKRHYRGGCCQALDRLRIPCAPPCRSLSQELS